MEKKRIIKNAMAISAAMTVTLGLSGCYSDAEKVMKKIEAKKYDEALLYFSELNMEQEDRSELVELLTKKLTETVSLYAKNEIDFDTASDIVETISQFQLEELIAATSTANIEISRLFTSKKMYEDGKRAYENKDYYSAISCFQNVIQADANYESATSLRDEAEEKYADFVIQQVTEMCEEKNYELALDLLSDAKHLLPRNEKIANQAQKTMEEYDKYLYETHKDKLMEEVQRRINKSDFEEAIIEINRFKRTYNTKDEEIESLLKTCKEGYEKLILDKVEVLRQEKKYLKAIEVLTNAQEVIVSERFTSMLKTLEDEKPIYLSDVKCQNSNRFELVTSGDPPVDTIGNRYELSNLYVVSAEHESWSSPDTGYADFYLGYKYQTLRGTVAVDDMSDNVSCNLEIIGDGVVLVSVPLDRLTAPVPFSVDVSNVNILTLKLTDLEKSDVSFYVILADHYFEK